MIQETEPMEAAEMEEEKVSVAVEAEHVEDTVFEQEMRKLVGDAMNPFVFNHVVCTLCNMQERQMSMKNPKFESEVSKIEQIVTEQEEEGVFIIYILYFMFSVCS